MKFFYKTLLVAVVAIVSSCTTDADDEWSASNVCPESKRGTFVDERDGQTYKYSTIGNQVWMAQNLNYKGGRDTCLYDDGCVESGRLYYNCSAECPPGWRMPDSEEWEILLTEMEGAKTNATKLKSVDGWIPLNPDENANGTDECELNIKPWNMDSKQTGRVINYLSSRISSGVQKGVVYLFFTSAEYGFAFSTDLCHNVHAYARCIKD